MDNILSQIAAGPAPVNIMGAIQGAQEIRNNALASQALRAQMEAESANQKAAIQQQLKTVNIERAKGFFNDLAGALTFSFDNPNMAKGMIKQAMSKLDPVQDQIYYRGAQELLNMDGTQLSEKLFQAVDHGSQFGYLKTNKSLAQMADESKRAERETVVKERAADTDQKRLETNTQLDRDKMANELFIANSRLGMDAQNLAFNREKLAAENARADREYYGGKVPPGYQRKADGSGVEPMPNTKEAIARGEAAEAKKKELQYNFDNAMRAYHEIDPLVKKLDMTTTGRIGQGLAWLGSPDAINVREDLAHFKSMLSLGTLSALKSMSKTGAVGTGPTNQKEFEAFEKNIASLDQSQSPEQLKRNLMTVKSQYRKIISDVSEEMRRRGIDAPSVDGITEPNRKDQPYKTINSSAYNSSLRKKQGDTIINFDNNWMLK